MITTDTFIDLWHGGKTWYGGTDKGASFGGYTERDLLKPVAIELLRILRSKISDGNVYDVGIYSNARSSKKVKYINSVINQNWLDRNNCFVLSLHLNSSVNPASGIECWIPQQATKNGVEAKLAENLINRMNAYHYQRDRGVKQKRLYINDFAANTVLIECGFINDEKFLEYILNRPERLAESIANWYLTFLRDN